MKKKLEIEPMKIKGMAMMMVTGMMRERQMKMEVMANTKKRIKESGVKARRVRKTQSMLNMMTRLAQMLKMSTAS